jgi:hypothetical protein
MSLKPNPYFLSPQKSKARKSTGSVPQTNTFANKESGGQSLQRPGNTLASAIDLTFDISEEGVDETKTSEETVSPLSPKTSASIGIG